MGVLTWAPREGGFAFIFTRAIGAGEGTPEAPAPVDRPHPGDGQLTSAVAPLEPQGEGSRLSVNEYGLGLCMLGGVPAPGHSAPPASRSRARLLLELSAFRSELALGSHLLSEVPLGGYRPFTLAVFSRGLPPTFFDWDGVALRQRLATRTPYVSGALRLAQGGSRRLQTDGQPRSGGLRSTSELLRLHASACRRPLHCTPASSGTATASWLVVADVHGARVECFRGLPEAGVSSTVHSLPLASAPGAGDSEAPLLRAPLRTFDVPSLFAERGRGAYARLPRWVLSAIAHAVGQHAVNRFLFGLGAMPAEAFPEACLRQLRVEVCVRHALPYPLKGPPVYVANHPLGGVDGLALLALCLRRHGHTQAPVNALLTHIPHLAELCVPLDPERDARSLPATLRRVFQSDQPIALFPAGSASRRSGGVLADGPWAPMVASYCLRYSRPIVPVFIGGHNSAAFYATASARKRLRVGVNLEMFLLPREALSPVVRRLEMHVGQPVEPEELSEMGSTNLERAAALRDRCYELGEAL